MNMIYSLKNMYIIQPLTQLVSEVLSLEVKWLRCEADNLPRTSTTVSLRGATATDIFTAWCLLSYGDICQ
jgi:hypothetical protein